ncbi:MAG: phage N-6-adenine-methyltransferase [Pantoea sp.]|uniref:Phage N-6-adenine-methyltransferase n=1 Tax=Pantoea septica TaxID=472695 RepID=A0ABX3UV75_9GAMM|nr:MULTISPECIES: phage N-6-adenine-methyltransferase [Gammaproteobacteria]MDU5780278.1 phage N-6-adenine-methyltransferase [Pantoea sp.]ORN01967.1 phage N-6-adenine-methyltransferase [Pantoea septica]
MSEAIPRRGYHDSHTNLDIRDLWQTPLEVFAALNRDFRFVADVAASEHNHLLPVYFTEKDDALAQDWAGRLPLGITWCNPPYSEITPWIKKATEECRKGIGTVMLVPADTSVSWFSLARNPCTEVRFIIDGRLSFIHADTGKPVNGNNKGSMLLIWNPFASGFGITGYVSRDTLMAIGRKLLLSGMEPADERAA